MAAWAETGFKVSDTTPTVSKSAGGTFYWKMDGVKVSVIQPTVSKSAGGTFYWKMDGAKAMDTFVAQPKFTSTPNLKWGTIGNVAFQKVLVGEMRVVKDIFQFWG